jgi:hypothetical protein
MHHLSVSGRQDYSYRGYAFHAAVKQGFVIRPGR